MTDTNAPIGDLLQQLTNSLDALAACQQEELSAVVDREHAQVAQLAQQKVTLLEQVQQLDTTLSQHPDKQQLKDNPELAQAVSDIKDQLAQVQQQNAVNERVVQSTLNSIEQLKQAILTSAKKDSLTYDAKGKVR